MRFNRGQQFEPSLGARWCTRKGKPDLRHELYRKHAVIIVIIVIIM